MGKRRQEEQSLWVATADLPRSPGRPFHIKLNGLLNEAGFDAWVENLCAPLYVTEVGRPSIPPG